MTQFSEANQPRHRHWRAFAAESGGNVAIEMAFLMTFLIMLVLGAYDFGRWATEQATVTQAARAGTQWAVLDQANATDTDGMIQAARDEADDVNNELVIPTPHLLLPMSGQFDPRELRQRLPRRSVPPHVRPGDGAGRIRAVVRFPGRFQNPVHVLDEHHAGAVNRRKASPMLHRLRSSIQFIRDLRGTAAIEFAFVAPVLFTLTIGTIDVGRMVWSHSMLNHMAREATRYASVRGAESNNTVSKADMQTYVANRLIGVDPGEVNVTVTWTPSNSSGGTIFIQLDYQYNFLIGGLVGLDPIALQGDSAMVVL